MTPSVCLSVLINMEMYVFVINGNNDNSMMIFLREVMMTIMMLWMRVLIMMMIVMKMIMREEIWK